MQHPTEPRFEAVDVTLAYRVGEFKLFERRLHGFADRRHFLEQSADEGIPELPAFRPGPGFFFFPTYPVTQPPPTLACRGSWLHYTPYTFRNYYVDMARLGTFDAYLGTFSGKTRSTLRRKVKRFAEASDGEIQWCEMRSAAEMDEFLRLALPLSEGTYQARLLGVGLPQSPEFAAELKERAAAGEVRGYLLFLGGKPVAYVLCLCRHGIATYDYVGFDREQQALSPGTVLQFLMLEKMFADGDLRVFDFTEGEGEQKRLFATNDCLCAKTYVLEATPVNLLSIQFHRLLDRASATVGRLLDRLGVKATVRRLLRRAA